MQRRSLFGAMGAMGAVLAVAVLPGCLTRADDGERFVGYWHSGGRSVHKIERKSETEFLMTTRAFDFMTGMRNREMVLPLRDGALIWNNMMGNVQPITYVDGQLQFGDRGRWTRIDKAAFDAFTGPPRKPAPPIWR